MNHPAKYIDECFRFVGRGDTTIDNIAERFQPGTKKLPSLWLALPTDRVEENFAFIFMPSPTAAQIGEKIQTFYKMYLDLQPSWTDNGPMQGLVYPEGAKPADQLFPDLYNYEGGRKYIVLIQFGS